MNKKVQKENITKKEKKKFEDKKVKDKEISKEVEEIKDKKIKKKKHKGLKVILILIIIGGCLFTAYYFYNDNQNKISTEKKNELLSVLKQENKSFEYGSEITYDELLNSLIDTDKLNDNITYEIYINDEIKLDEENYKFMQVGDTVIKTIIKEKDNNQKRFKIHVDFSSIKNFIKNFKITYDSTEYIKEQTNIYTVTDTVMPVIEGVADKTITKGSSIDLKDGITATDAVDGELEVTIEGEVDTDKVGEYTIKVLAKDNNSNEVSDEFKVTVKEKQKKSTKTTTSNSTKTSSSSSSSSNGRRYSSALIKKYYKNCTDDQIDEAEAIAKSIAEKALAYSTDKLTQVQYAAYLVSEYYWRYCDYDTSYSNPYYRSPYGVFVAGIATCSGTTRALGRVLDHMGYTWTHVHENEYQHQWCKLTIDGQTVWADGMAGTAGTGEYFTE